MKPKPNTHRRRPPKVKVEKCPPPIILEAGDPRSTPDWTKGCENCGEKPILPLTGMCGPCTFGEAETAGGKW